MVIVIDKSEEKELAHFSISGRNRLNFTPFIH